MSESPQKKRLISKGKNSAGYEVFERKIVKEKDGKTESAVMSRRKMILGGLSNVLTGIAVSGLPLEKIFIQHEDREKESLGGESAQQLDDLLTELQTEASTSAEKGESSAAERSKEIETVSESKHFFAEVHRYMEYYAQDLGEVLLYATKTTKGDEKGRSRMQYVSEELRVDGVPDVLASELQTYIVGLCDVESSFNAAKKSQSGAAGLMQFMKTTFEEHAQEGADILSLVAQVDAAKDKFKQIYRYVAHTCKDELAVIEAEFFFGDDERFEREFLTPVIINGYNAGEGIMSDVLKWFVKKYGTEEKTVGVFGEGEAVSGYDVFLALAKRGYEEKAHPHYGSDASSYVMKVYGATRALSFEDADA